MIVNKKITAPIVSYTPSFFRSTLQQYNNGYPGPLIQLMKSSDNDSVVSGCLSGRRAGIKRPWTLAPYDDTPKARDRAQWLEGVVEGLQPYSLFEAILEAKLYSFNVIDFPEWDSADGHQFPTEFKAYEQFYFQWKDEKLYIRSTGTNLKEIPSGVLVVKSRRKPEMIPIVRDFLLKDFGLEAMASYVERFGEPFMIGYYPPGSDPKIRDELDAGLKSMGSSAIGTAPKGTEIEIKETKRNTGPHLDFIEYADKGIMIGLLGHANALQQSSGMQVGENISAWKVIEHKAVDDLFFVEQEMARLIRIIGDQNWNDGKYPWFQIDKSEPLTFEQRLKMVNLGYTHGVTIMPNEYRKLGLEITPDQQPITRKDPFDPNLGV